LFLNFRLTINLLSFDFKDELSLDMLGIENMWVVQLDKSGFVHEEWAGLVFLEIENFQGVLVLVGTRLGEVDV